MNHEATFASFIHWQGVLLFLLQSGKHFKYFNN